MAKTNAERSAKAAAKKRERGEEEIRLHCLPGTRQALAELMAWNGIEEINEAVQNLLLNAHALGPTLSYQAMESPRHKVQISENVARMFQRESMLMIQQDPGDEIQSPDQSPK